MQLEGAQERLDRHPGVEQRQDLGDQPVHVASGLSSEHHAIGELEHVAAGGEAFEVGREPAKHAEELAAHEEGEIGARTLAEDGADVDEGLERARKAAARVLRPLGDAGQLPLGFGDQRDDAVRLAVRPGAKDECLSGDFEGHERDRAVRITRLPHPQLDKQGSGAYVGGWMVDGKDDRPEADEEAVAADEVARPDAGGGEALAAAREEARQNHDRWLRAAAELDNFKKRMARERAEAVRFANESFLRDLLPVVDNLERALEHARQGGNGQSIVAGLELVLKGLADVLERHGVTKVDAAGAAFDPTHHEAVAHVETPDLEPNRVLEQHQPGYVLNERLLRPALVSVSKAPASDAKLAKDKARG